MGQSAENFPEKLEANGGEMESKIGFENENGSGSWLENNDNNQAFISNSI